MNVRKFNREIDEAPGLPDHLSADAPMMVYLESQHTVVALRLRKDGSGYVTVKRDGHYIVQDRWETGSPPQFKSWRQNSYGSHGSGQE